MLPKDDQAETANEADSKIEIVVPNDAILTGKHVKLHPTKLERLEQLFEALGGEGNDILWDYIPLGPFADIEAFRKWLQKVTERDSGILYAIEDIKTNRIVGCASINHSSPEDGVLAIGCLFGLQLQKTVGATESFYLMASKAFEVGCRRMEWRCDNINEGSKRAALRFGFTLDGVLRKHKTFRGQDRDTAIFSLLDSEWPGVKIGLEKWFDVGNFDQSGRQRQKLSYY